jgi:hypothetical protein
MSRTISLLCGCGHTSRYDFTEEAFSADCAECGDEFIYEGEDSFRFETGGESIVLNLEQHEIGREGAGRIVIEDGKISRHHCTLRYVDSGYTITDEGSLNGTFVNGKKLRKGSPVRLHVGDRVKLWLIELSYWGPVEETIVSSKPPAARWEVSRRSNTPQIVGSLAAFMLLGVAVVVFVNSRGGNDDPGKVRGYSSPFPSDELAYDDSFEDDDPGEPLPEDDMEGPEPFESDLADLDAPVPDAGTAEVVVDTPAESGAEVIEESVPDPIEKLPVPPVENRLFALSFLVKIDGEKFDREDRQTWTRVGYYLQHESGEPYYLVFPDGKVKHIQGVGDDPAESGGGRSGGHGPTGDPSRARYRIRIKAETSKKDVKFYNKKLMKKFSCEMVCHLEERGKSGKFSRVQAWKFRESMTRAIHEDMDEDLLSQKVFYLALETLVTSRFQEARMFARKDS